MLVAYYSDKSDFNESSSKLRTAFEAGRVEEAINIFKSIFASIPYNLPPKEKKNSKKQSKDISTKEAYYHTVFYVMLLSLGADIRVEILSSKGRMDALLNCDDYIYVIEFKIDQSSDVALEQIDTQEYDKQFVYDPEGRTVYKLGINFNTKLRNIDDWKLK